MDDFDEARCRAVREGVTPDRPLPLFLALAPDPKFNSQAGVSTGSGERRGQPAANAPRATRRDRLRADPGDGDDKIRLNAAVRLAYLGSSEGVRRLEEGLCHTEAAIRLVQVPEALAQLGETGLTAARRLVRQSGPARLAAAQTLARAGELAGVEETIVAVLADSDRAELREALSLAGELGTAADGVAETLGKLLDDPQMAEPVALRRWPRWPVHRLCPSSSNASGTSTQQCAWVPSGLWPDWDRSGSASAPRRRLCASAERRSGTRNHLGRPTRRPLAGGRVVANYGPTGAGLPRRAERSGRWPLWESRFVLKHNAHSVDEAMPKLLSTLVEYLNADDYDLRRNARLALAFTGRFGWTAGGELEKAPDCRHRLGPRYPGHLQPIGVRRGQGLDRRDPFAQLDPTRWPWDLERHRVG